MTPVKVPTPLAEELLKQRVVPVLFQCHQMFQIENHSFILVMISLSHPIHRKKLKLFEVNSVECIIHTILNSVNI